jgi:hypothetical protein
MPQHANQYPATHFQRSSIHKNIKELERLYFPTPFINCHSAENAITARYGKGKVFSVAEGIGPRSWQMMRSKFSKRPTTLRDELMTVR